MTITPEKEAEQERAARIIAPDYWDAHDVYAQRAVEWHTIEPGGRLALQFRKQADDLVAPSLALADQILSPILNRLSSERQEREKAERENVHLRLIHQKVGCPYGHASATGGCSLGYPGCACMDDALAMMAWGPEDEDKAAVRLGQRLRAAEAQRDELVEACRPFAAIEPSSLYPADGSNAEDYMVLLRSGFSNPIAFTGADLARLRALSTIDTTGAKT